MGKLSEHAAEALEEVGTVYRRVKNEHPGITDEAAAVIAQTVVRLVTDMGREVLAEAET